MRLRHTISSPLHRPVRGCARALVACAALVLLLAPPAGAAAKKDPVLAAINAARASKAITPAEAVQLRSDWARSARAQRTARTASRRASIAAVRSYTTRLASRRALTPERVRPVMLSVKATTWVMLYGSFPSHEQEVVIPGEPVVFTYYSGRGVQFQPFETFKQGLRELNKRTPDNDAARVITDRMLQLSVRRGTSITWEYYFPFGGPATPWTSAISQSVATELLYRVGDAAEDPASRARYHAAAEDVARSFMRSTSVGGVGVVEGKGRFYVMYSFHPRQRILNGHLQVLINLNRYAEARGSVVARRVVDQGIAAVLPIMPRFDTGAWSNYQYGQEATRNYHEFQTDQLVKIGKEHEHEELAEYGARFERYLVTPPKVAFPGSDYPVIFPADDGFRDSVAIPVSLDKRARVTLIVRDANGAEVNRTSINGGRGRHVIRWNGKRSGGARAEPGEYAGQLTVTDVMGNRAFADVPKPLRVVADQFAPTLRRVTLRERSGTSIVTASAFDAGSGWITASLRIDGRIVATVRGPRNGSVVLRTKRALADVRRGQLLLTDTSGNQLVHPLGS